MAVEIEIDVQVLKSEIKKTYASVSQEPENDFIFPTGRPWAEDLAYPAELAKVPETAVGSFAGVANPWQLGRLALGERVLDLGSGAGTDSLVAAQMVGEHGHVNGIDMTPEMLSRARAAAGEMNVANVEFVESERPDSSLTSVADSRANEWNGKEPRQGPGSGKECRWRRASRILRQAGRWAECPVYRLPFLGANPVLRDGARSSEYD